MGPRDKIQWAALWGTAEIAISKEPVSFRLGQFQLAEKSSGERWRRAEADCGGNGGGQTDPQRNSRLSNA